MEFSYEQLHGRVERAEAFVHLTQRLGEVLDPRELGSILAESIAALVGDAVTVWVMPVGQPRLEAVATAHPDPAGQELLQQIQQTLGFGDPSGIALPVLESGKPLVITDYDAAGWHDESAPEYWPWLDRYGISSLVVLPMRARDRVIGVIGTTRDAGRPTYSTEDVEFVQALADCAAIAIDNAHLLRQANDAQDALRRQSQLVDQVSDAIIFIDDSGRIVSWNAAAEAIYGRRAEDVIGRRAQEVVHSVFLNTDGTELSRQDFLAQRMMDGCWRGETRERHADGHLLELLCSSTAVPGGEGNVAGFVTVNRDLTAQRAATHEALHDPLTGLPNRRLLMDRLTHALARASRRGSGLAVMFIDLDGFKAINDMYGHDEGDLILRTCARRLVGAMRASDTVTRLGGDEFVVIAEDIDNTAGAGVVADRIFAALDAAVPAGGDLIRISASVGIARSSGDDDAGALIRRADAAMYQAKREGSRWQVEAEDASP